MSLQTLRSFKIFGLSVFDILTAIIGLDILFVIARNHFFRTLPIKNFIIAGFFLAIPIGIAFHIIFGKNTFLNYNLGLSYKPQ